jgi:aspartate/tyrosine/aromatic aminotransferase
MAERCARRCSVVASRYHWRNYQTLFRAKGTETTRYTAPAVPQRAVRTKKCMYTYIYTAAVVRHMIDDCKM